MTLDLTTNIYQNKIPRLACENVSQSFNGQQILKNINITLYEKEIVSLIGVSGSGKTTLFNILAGIAKPDTGHVYINGQEITNESGHVAYMLQKDLLLQHLTVMDNVALPLFLKGHHKKAARQEAYKALERFGLEHTAYLRPSSLSGGMAQRAALCRTYLFNNEVALLDEPFSALDAITKRHIHSWYLDLMHDIKLSTLFITHDIDEAITLSSRIYVLDILPGVICKEVVIDAPYPRDDDFLFSEEFMVHKKEILALLQSIENKIEQKQKSTL